jgi:hypothetical protein
MMLIFRASAICTLTEVYRRLGGASCLHRQSQRWCSDNAFWFFSCVPESSPGLDQCPTQSHSSLVSSVTPTKSCHSAFNKAQMFFCIHTRYTLDVCDYVNCFPSFLAAAIPWLDFGDNETWKNKPLCKEEALFLMFCILPIFPLQTIALL